VALLILAACRHDNDPPPMHPQGAELPPLPPSSGTPVGYLVDNAGQLQLHDEQLAKLKAIDQSLGAKNAELDTQAAADREAGGRPGTGARLAAATAQQCARCADQDHARRRQSCTARTTTRPRSAAAGVCAARTRRSKQRRASCSRIAAWQRRQRREACERDSTTASRSSG